MNSLKNDKPAVIKDGAVVNEYRLHVLWSPYRLMLNRDKFYIPPEDDADIISRKCTIDVYTPDQ